MSADLSAMMASAGMAVPDSLAIDVFPCGGGTIRGIRATRDILKGDVLLKVPYSLLLNAENCLRALPALEQAILAADAAHAAREEAEAVPASQRHGPSLIGKSEFVMACYLVLCGFDPAHRQASPFRPLVDLLPTPAELPMVDLWYVTEFRSHDVHCPEFLPTADAPTGLALSREQMVALVGSTARFLKLSRRVEKQRCHFVSLQQRYFAMCPALFGPTVFTFPHWLWATAIINSRSFQYNRPKFSDYPLRYLGAAGGEGGDASSGDDGGEEDEASSDDGSDAEDGGEGKAIDADALVRACEKAVSHAKQQKSRETAAAAAVVASATPPPRPLSVTRKPLRRNIGGGGGGGSSSDSDDAAAASGGGAAAAAAPPAAASGYRRVPSEEQSAAADAAKDLYTLLPFGDMFNHDDSGTQDFGFDEKQAAFVIKSDRFFFQGEQVGIKYNSMDHWRFSKYYGFVVGAPPVSNAEPTGCNRNDAFPIVVPMPPRRTAVSHPSASVLDITKSALFEDPLLRKHCYVTSMGPNQSLLSGLRLLLLGEADFSRYTFAFQKDMISVRNEWHVFKFLLDAVTTALSEVKRYRNGLNAAGTCGLSERALVAVAVRDRDFRVLASAQKVCKTAYKNICELLYYGATADAVLRSNSLHAQLQLLRSAQHIPLTRAQLDAMGLGHMPVAAVCDGVIGNPFRSAQTGIDDIADVLHRRLTQPGRKPTVW